MKKTITIALLALTAVAAVAKDQFNTRCPKCLKEQVLTAKNVVGNGGYSTNINGVAGSMCQFTGNFKCKSCRAKFSSPIKPDKFVPTFVATPVKPVAK